MTTFDLRSDVKNPIVSIRCTYYKWVNEQMCQYFVFSSSTNDMHTKRSIIIVGFWFVFEVIILLFRLVSFKYTVSVSLSINMIFVSIDYVNQIRCIHQSTARLLLW